MPIKLFLILIIIILIIIIISIICYNQRRSTIKRSPKIINLYDEDKILKKYLKSIKHKLNDIDNCDDVGYPLF